MADEFKIKYGAIIEGTTQVTGGNITLDDLATIDGMDPSAHIATNGSAHHTATTSLNGFMSSGDKTKLDGLQNYTHPNHYGDVTSLADGATTIASGVIDDDNIATGANIALAKLENGTKILLNNGDVTMAANFNMSTAGTKYKIINLGAPTNADDAVTKAYVDAAVSGFNLKDPVRVATTTAQNLATDFENGDTIDGIVLATGDRILIKDQADASEHGIYTINASGAPTRSGDADSSTEVTIGMTVFVEEGTTNANSSWALSAASANPIIIDDTEITFTLFARTGEIKAGNGLTKSGDTLHVGAGTGLIANTDDIALTGQALALHNLATNGIITRTAADTITARTITGTTNRTTVTNGNGVSGNPTIDISVNYVGQSTITTLGTITTGVWNGTTITIANGGTAATSASAAFNNLSPMTKLGDIIYGGASGAGTVLVGNTDTTTKFLASTGDGTFSAAPAWRALSVSHISDLNSTISTALSTYTGSATIATVGTITSGTWASSTVIAGAYGGTGVANTGKTFTISGNVSIGSGTNTVTLTTSGTTNVALPTEGTLATIAGTENLLNKTINKVTITAPATSATLTIANGKTLVCNNSLTFTGNDSASIGFGAGGTVAYTSNKLSAFASTTSAELAGVISDETGSGSLVFATSPTLVTPTLGVATATSINKLTITAPATSAILTIADGKTLTASNTLTLTGTDGSSIAFGNGGTVAYTANKLSAFSSTTSAELAGVISDETGYSTGAALVFSISPALTGTPTAPTPSSSDDSTKIATTEFVKDQGYLTSTTAASTYQPLDADLTAIAALTGTSGFLKTNGAGTWSVDTGTYLPLSGGTMAGTINMNGNSITNIGTTTHSSSTSITSAVNGKITHTHAGTSAETLVQIAYSTVDAIIFEYVAYNATKNAVRAGVFIATHNSGNSPQKAHYTTNDSGGSTAGYVLSVNVVSTNILIQGTAPAAGWEIKGYVRTL